MIRFHNVLSSVGTSLIYFFSGPQFLSKWLYASKTLIRRKPKERYANTESAEAMREKNGFDVTKKSYIQHVETSLVCVTPRVSHDALTYIQSDFNGPEGPVYQKQELRHHLGQFRSTLMM